MNTIKNILDRFLKTIIVLLLVWTSIIPAVIGFVVGLFRFKNPFKVAQECAIVYMFWAINRLFFWIK